MSSSDQLVRFLFREKDVRGEIVKVASSLDLMLQNHQYAHPVKQLLAELVAATSLLTATLKFEGNIAVQVQGDGPVKFAAVNGNNHQQFRGVVRMQSEIKGDSFIDLIGEGFLLVTVTPDQGERYQGVIPITGNSLTETLEAYFKTGGNLMEMSRELFLHYNSVLYRLNRIREITGVGLEDEDQKLKLAIALKIRKLVNHKDPEEGIQ